MPSSKEKLAVLGTRGIPACYGGFETFAEELSLRLVNRDFDVTVFCEKKSDSTSREHLGIRLEYVPAPRLGPLTTVLYDLFCLWRARKGYRVVYMLGYGSALFCFLPRLWGSRVWLNIDGIEWARGKWNYFGKLYFRFMESIAVRVVDRIIADSKGIRDFIIRRYHKMIKPISVIAYGAPIVEIPPDITRLWNDNLVPNDYYLMVCRLEPENHVREIMEGFKASRTSKKLVIVGNHRIDTPYVRNILDNHDDRVLFLGAVYERDILTALRYHAYAYFHGHSVGGTNPSLLEALGCGNIVIAHDNVFNREVLGLIGYYFTDPTEVPSLVATIDSLSAFQRKELMDMARERIRSRYHWDSITDQYYELLKSI